MDWTAEQDDKLRALQAKRVSPAFIASWMRWPPAAVRARLIELGLARPLSPKGASIANAAKTRTSSLAQSSSALRAVDSLRDAFDDDEELKTRPGCPRGHLLSERQIAALYRVTGSNYR